MPLFPLALEQLDLSGFDLIISSESGPSKGVLTAAGACHICYCHSPMRYIWEMPHAYRATAPGGRIGRMIFGTASHYMRLWDYATGARVDHFLASSNNGALRIRKVYRREATIIYPPVAVENFSIDEGRQPGDFYLVVSRLVSYKRIDLAVAACNALGRKLVIIGEGEEKKALQRLAGPTITFLGEQPDQEVRRHLRQCRAFLFPGEEDIGLAPIEAQASGRPVIAYGRGGALETVMPLHPSIAVQDATGVFFPNPSAESLQTAMETFEQVERQWCPERIRAHALKFGRERFRRQFTDFVYSRYHQSRGAVAAGHTA